MKSLKKFIRDVPDFPKKGVIFKDITTLLKEGKVFKETINLLAEKLRKKKIDKIVSMEARGFIFGGALAYKLGCGFVPVRKKNKLPWKKINVTYELEYGTDTLEIHQDAITKGENILIVDDVLATGGTVKSVVELVEKLGGRVIACTFLIELAFLHGRDKLKKYKIYYLMKY
ncbi:adenine phosphoribosyltransferase [candidate division NPL-UPA2 bacterium Unc8]|uniref:Adenine phosphoribosyltransferase n=2 Tax=Bacteria TaxID=2 RepID=A0A9E2BLV7_PSYF1|nr:Adenine phosphoribosyltransferase [Candidatus Psychracetigena formicireducens]MBT9147309.1 Adenine phosphoribosyltransferase [Bacillota bacterium]RII00407.1 MAG: adenine phosphoribosyltransferase [candidate division NPL-UPA2 bacterium Unc8]